MPNDNDLIRLKDALVHEEKAVKLYRQYSRECKSEIISEMFEQFAMNESWHATAIREKIEKLEKNASPAS